MVVFLLFLLKNDLKYSFLDLRIEKVTLFFYFHSCRYNTLGTIYPFPNKMFELFCLSIVSTVKFFLFGDFSHWHMTIIYFSKRPVFLLNF